MYMNRRAQIVGKTHTFDKKVSDLFHTTVNLVHLYWQQQTSGRSSLVAASDSHFIVTKYSRLDL